MLGHEADLRRVGLLAGLAPDDVAAAVGGLRREGILAPGADLDFTHPLVRTAVYSDVDELERSLAHGRAARILADEGDHEGGRIATQLLPATPQGDPWVVAELRGAAEKALADGAPTSAAAFLERALAEPPRPEDRIDLQFDLGRAHARSGQIDAASAAFHAALAAESDPVRRAAIAVELGRSLRLAGHVPGAISLLDRTISDLPPGHDELALTLEAEIAVAGHMGLPKSGWIERLLDVARRATGPSLPERTLRGFQAYVSASIGASTAAEVADLASSSIRPAEDVDPSILQGVAAALAMSGRLADATRILDRSAAIAQELGNANQFAFVMSTRTWVATRAGRVRDGEADARALLAIPGVSAPYLGYAAGHAVFALVERDALSEARALLVQHGLAETAQFPGLPGAITHLARGRLARMTGHVQEAIHDVESCREILEAFGFTGPAFGEWREEVALSYLAAGRHDRAVAVADEDVELSRAYGGARELGIALRTRGLVDGGAAGMELLQEAVQVLRDSEALLDLAKAQVELGAALRRTGRRTEAREHLGAGLDLASRCGATTVASRARSELTAVGARPRRERLTGPEALTASELRVARLAVEGLSNPEIAQSLFVTRRTVEVHLTHAYRKLGIDSRAALRSALEDGRWDAPPAAGDVAGGTRRQPSRHPMSGGL